MDLQFARNIDAHLLASRRDDLFRISADTDPKGERSRPPAQQDPDMLLPVVRETDVGIVVREAETHLAVRLCPVRHRAGLSSVEPLRGNRGAGGL